MANTIQLKEYEKKNKSEIACCDLESLEKYLERNKLSSALKVTASGVKARNYVGVIKFKNTQFEILPKLISQYKDDNKLTDEEKEKQNQIILKNLVFMLSYTKHLDIKSTSCAKLAKTQNPFLEVLIREFAESLFECLKRLTPKNYIREEDNLNYLKGKLKFTENIRYNSANQAKFYCEFDEFSENCVLNQLFNYVSICLHSISKDSNNKKLLKFIINYYQDIKLVRFDKFKCQKIRLNRNQQLFKKPFELAKMFVEQSSVDLSKNKFENITLLWDMNELFEEFIYQVMKKHNIADVSPQKKKRLLVCGGSTYRDTKVDIMVYKDKTKKIPEKVIDTKYKRFESLDDVASADIYQVSTYCLLHGVKEAILLYPQWGEEEIEITKNTYNLQTQEEYKLHFKSIDLKKDLKSDLKKANSENSDSEIIKKLKNILNKETEKEVC